KNSGIQPSNSPPKLSFQPTQKRKIAKVKKVLVVSSGKGGVGKSTISVNLAISLSKLSIRVGLLDLDIFGPSIPKLMNLENLTPSLNRDNALIPLRNHGISCMSIGFLLPQDSESRSNSMVAWRGMMVMKAVQQLLFDVDWSNSERSKECETISNDDSSLDVLVIDMPPGTGDVAISLGQLVEIDGAVIVTTPQDIALIDVTKGLNMFRKLNIPVIGTVLNMSSFTCPNCKSDLKIFGSTQSFENLLKSSGLVELGKVPLNIEINRSSDNGKPISTKSNFASSDPNTNIANNKGDLDCKNHIENGTYFDEISKKCFDSLFKPI
ncbi:P-loop containing nucleoside triphosphate hydrolase protein, partial [Phakopsora pachyrhizi]